MKILRALVAFSALAVCAYAQQTQYTISTIAGIGGVEEELGDGGQATNATLFQPSVVAVDSSQNFYFGGYRNATLRTVAAATGILNNVTGNGIPGFSGDGDADNLAEIGPEVGGIVVDTSGSLFFSDTNNFCVRKISTAGVITLFAGTGAGGGYSGDGGQATNALFMGPTALALDPFGNIFVVDPPSQTVRKITGTGIISTFAGINAQWGYNGDGIPAAQAQLESPTGIAIDGAGNVYIAEANDIRKINTSGIISTYIKGISAVSLAADGAGNLYYVDGVHNYVYKIAPGASPVSMVIAGSGARGFSGDGQIATSFTPLNLATTVDLNQPQGVAVDSSGNVYVADTENDVIRVLTPRYPGQVLNAASERQGPIAPGEIVTIFGSGLGPAALTQVPGQYPTLLAGTQVTFNGTPAPIVYTSSTVVAAIVPFGIGTATGATAAMALTYNGQTVVTNTVSVAPTAPGIFSKDTTGAGQAAAVNFTGGGVNAPKNPVATGDFLELYVTGAGQTSPGGVDGQVASASNPLGIVDAASGNCAAGTSPVCVLIDGTAVVPSYAGWAPTLVEGVIQINVQIPAGILQSPSVANQTLTQIPVQVTIGAQTSPTVLIAVTQ